MVSGVRLSLAVGKGVIDWGFDVETERKMGQMGFWRGSGFEGEYCRSEREKKGVMGSERDGWVVMDDG